MSNDAPRQNITGWLVKLIWGSNIRIPKKPKPMTTVFEPATPEPRYICENCGMTIETGHKHTRPECKEYKESPMTPDMRLIKVMLEKQPARNDPKVRLPYYYDSLRPIKKGDEE